MRAVVTGGAGFIGSHLVDRLLAEGHAVDVVDDLSSGSLANLASARADATRTGAELKFHHLDVRAPELADLLGRRRPDVVHHLAASPPAAGARVGAEVAFVGALNVLEAGAYAGAAKVVVAVDAALLYGPVASRDLPVRDGHTWQPVGVAGATARAVTDLLVAYRSQRNLEYTALALSSVYGPRQAATRGVVAAFVAADAAGVPASVHGDGRQTRDFLYVDDAVDAFVRASTRGSGLVVNVGTGVQTTVRDLHRLVLGPSASWASAPARPDEIGRFAVSPVRARIHLGWAPWTALADGIELTRRAT
jgi:UDP-glucose 4-epimerase